VELINKGKDFFSDTLRPYLNTQYSKFKSVVNNKKKERNSIRIEFVIRSDRFSIRVEFLLHFIIETDFNSTILRIGVESEDISKKILTLID
jgi:hypothetical protein